MKHVTIDIDGMENASSADNLTKALKLIEGAHRIYVYYEGQQANIEYDESKVSPQEFVSVIEKSGYSTHCECP